MNENIDIAIIGAETPTGEALLEQLKTRNFPVEKLIPLAFEDDSDSDTDTDSTV